MATTTSGSADLTTKGMFGFEFSWVCVLTANQDCKSKV
jgi:hypothetical protein